MRSAGVPEPPPFPGAPPRSPSLSQQTPPVPAAPVVPVAEPPQVRGTRHQAAREFLRNEPLHELPAVTVPGGLVTITASAEALFKAIAPTKQMFYRAGGVVELINEGEGYTVNQLIPAAAQSRFEKYVRFVKENKLKITGLSVPARTIINEATATKYLYSEACRTCLPPLNGIIHCALMIERDNQLHRLTHGYDDTTGLFVTSRQQPEVVTLEQAVEFLTGMLDEFDFVTPGDRSRAIASLLTPALKLGGFIKGRVPVDVAEANVSQSGKTYRQRMVGALYNQKLGVVVQKAGGAGSMEETFNDLLIKGRVFIQFDNVKGKLNSPFLESYMTAEDSFSARIPYAAPVQIDPSKFIVFISSNGFEATKDLANRASIIRIRRRDNYQFRTHNGKDVLQLLFELHPLFIGCVFAVVEEWHRRGKLRTNELRHDLREWCQSLDWIVQNIFHAAPLMDGHQEAKERATSPQLTWLREVAIKLNEQHKLNRTITASAIADLCLEEHIELPGLPAEKQTREEGLKQVGRIMSRLFGEDRNELIIEEFRVVRRQMTSASEAGNTQTLKTYTFSLLSGAGGSQQAPAPPVPPSSSTTTPSEPPSNLRIANLAPAPAARGEDEPRPPELPLPPPMPVQPPPPPPAPRPVLPQQNPATVRTAGGKKRRRRRSGGDDPLSFAYGR